MGWKPKRKLVTLVQALMCFKIKSKRSRACLRLLEVLPHTGPLTPCHIASIQHNSLRFITPQFNTWIKAQQGSAFRACHVVQNANWIHLAGQRTTSQRTPPPEPAQKEWKDMKTVENKEARNAQRKGGGGESAKRKLKRKRDWKGEKKKRLRRLVYYAAAFEVFPLRDTIRREKFALV